jgi:23S rRNA (uridine2552-2'-O)-methyltransferase
MKRSKSSRRWLDEHFSDTYVKQAQRSGLRSRAAFKLQEIQEKDRLIRPGQVVVDLGAAPGGWSQVVREWVGSQGRVLALDILPMQTLSGVEFIQGDFTEEAVLTQLKQQLQQQAVDVVLSDMAPNMSGNKAIDQPKGIYLSELALDFALTQLKPGGDFLVKVFQGAGFDALLRQMKAAFQQVVVRKPQASRARSAETYLLARKKSAF